MRALSPNQDDISGLERGSSDKKATGVILGCGDKEKPPTERFDCEPARGEAQAKDGAEIRLSPRRWAILFGVCAIGLQNGLVADLSPILATMVELLGVELKIYVYLLQLFSYVAPLVAIPTGWCVDKYGLKRAAYAALALVCLRNGTRCLFFSTELPLWAQLKFVYWFTAGLSENLLLLIYYCLPLKLSESWFSERERPIAWSLMYVNPLTGSVITNLIMPCYITGTDKVYLLARVNLICLVFVVASVTICVTKSRPKHPASARQLAQTLEAAGRGQGQVSLWDGLRCLSRRGNVVVQLLVLGTFDALLLAIGYVLQDVLAAAGLSQVFTGQFNALINSISATFMLCGAIRVGMGHRSGQTTKAQLAADKLELETSSARTCKQYLCAICLLSLVYFGTFGLRLAPEYQCWIILGVASAYTALRYWAAPRFVSLAASLISGAVTEATYSSVERSVKSALGTAYAVVFVHLRRKEADGRVDYSGSLLFAGALALAATLAYTLLFRVDQPSSGGGKLQLGLRALARGHSGSYEVSGRVGARPGKTTTATTGC